MRNIIIKTLKDFFLKWNYQAKIILVIGVINAGVLLGYLVDIRSLQQQLVQQDKNQKETKNQIDQANKIKAEELKVANLAANYTDFYDYSEALNVLGKLSNKLTVSLAIVKPETSHCDEKFCYFPFSLTIIGSYEHLVKFIYYILDLPYLVEIQSYKIVANNNAIDEMQKQMDIRLIFYKNNFDWPKLRKINLKQKKIFDATKINKTSLRDLFIFDNNLIAKGDLTKWSADNLKMLGCMQIDSQIAAIVIDPLGRLYKILPGIKIGTEKRLVTNVTCEAISSENYNLIQK